ncbi:peroxidase-related enzyme [Aeromicrobium panaciterrae]|uniref:peroxidase-related enzyme n=1 Tax=Aeromicrobium panaciterrae TaxID=363861 RepID=UPI0031E2DFB8
MSNPPIHIEERGSYLRIPSADQLPDELQAILDGNPEERAMRASSLSPGHFLAFVGLAGRLMDPDDGSLTLEERELIAVVVSAENRCPTCLVNHTRALADLSGDVLRAQRIAVNYRSVGLSSREMALADFAARLTAEPHTSGAAGVEDLREVGLDDIAISHVVELVALFNYTNRISSGLGLHPSSPV